MWKCKRCGKAVYFAERKTSLGFDWHPQCLRCAECQKVLNPGQHAEHKGDPYCHIPCYSVLFGPTLFGHGSQVEAHTSFGRAAQRPGQNIPRSHLEAKLKLYNQHQEGKSTSIQSRERNGRLILEGSLKIYWGVNQVIRLKEDHDDRMPVRRRQSCRIKSDLTPRVLSFPKHNSNLIGLSNEEVLNHLINLSAQESKNDEPHSRMYKTLPLSLNNPSSIVKPIDTTEDDKENDTETVVLTGELANVALRRQPGRKRNSKLRRRCSINGHFYNRETSMFTPSHGIMTSIWVTSFVTPAEVINMLLDKFKVKNKADDFSLVVIHDSGEQHLIQDNEYPLLVRVMLGPNEDIAKVFIMEKRRSLEISNEVAQFINLSEVELQGFIRKYDEEERREETKIRQKFLGMKMYISRRLKQIELTNQPIKQIEKSQPNELLGPPRPILDAVELNPPLEVIDAPVEYSSSEASSDDGGFIGQKL